MPTVTVSNGWPTFQFKQTQKGQCNIRWISESLQYNATLAITEAIEDWSHDKLYQELGLEYLQQRRWIKKFSQILQHFPCISLQNWILQKLFFHISLMNGINLIQTFAALIIIIFCCDAMLKFKRPVERKIFSINDPIGIKMLTILRLHFSHLCEHKFRYGFKHTLKPLCTCSIEAKTTTQYFLRFHLYNSNQATLVNDLFCG